MSIYPGNPVVEFEHVHEVGKSSSALTKITLGSHTGTHIDAPSHIDPVGAHTGAYTLDLLIGTAEVVDCTSVKDVITARDMPVVSGERVLIRTRNSDGDPDIFDPNFIALDESAAIELAHHHVRLVGIDGPSVKKKGVSNNVHKILLDAGVVVLEGIWLKGVQPGQYELICLPLRLGLDGAPVRAVLRTI